jgi:hypothetical protein
MKTFNQLISEVQEPLSQGEKNFKGLHNPINHKDLVPGVTDQDHVFNGTPQRKDPKTASYEDQSSEKAYDKNMKIDPARGQLGGKGTAAQAQGGMEEETSLEEKTLTSAEMRKREEIVKSLKKKGMEKSKAYAIATATAKKVAEETKLDEMNRFSDPDDKKSKGNMTARNPNSIKAKIDAARKKAAALKAEKNGGMKEEVELDEANKDAHFAKQSQKMQDAINMHLRKGKTYADAVKAAKVHVKEETELDEARRGRPRKDGTKPEGDEEGGREHIIMQLRKVVNLRGQKKVEFNDDSKHDISVDHAKKALAKHDSMHRAADKQGYAEKLAKSHASFKSTVSEAVERRSQDINPEQGSADSTTMRSDRGAMKTYTTIGRDGRVKLVKHLSHAKEVNIGESKDMTPANMEKEIKHDCAKHVLHKEWGEGETVEGMHTIVETTEGEGHVTHYDVMFAHGIEQNVPVEDLEIKTIVEHWHKNYKPKGKMKEGKEHTVPKSAKEKDLAAMAEPKDKITHKDVLVGRGVIKKAVKEAVNMQSDSLKKLKKDPCAGDDIKTDLPPTQGNKAIGGEGDPSRVGGKYSVEEEKLMKLYDSLSEENKSIFEAMIENDNGVEQLLAFAEEQGF